MLTFYKYIIYRVYTFFEKKDSTPLGDTVLIMLIVHVFQFATIQLYFSLMLNWNWGYIPKSPLYYLVCVIVSVTYYFIVFHNGNWRKWVKEFKKESVENKRKNGIKVWLFCWGSIALFFFSALLVLYIRH